jgi:hypothetical protein
MAASQKVPQKTEWGGGPVDLKKAEPKKELKNEPEILLQTQPVETGEKRAKPNGSTGIKEQFREAVTFAGRFEDQQTLGDRIALRDNTKRVSDNFKNPVQDIKSIIGLNEKFQFINILFKGDSVKYNSAIDLINSSSSSEEALKRVSEISDSAVWENYPGAAKSFIEIIERRFSV